MTIDVLYLIKPEVLSKVLKMHTHWNDVTFNDVWVVGRT